MAVSERERHGLYEKARQAFGDEEAGTLMELLAQGAEVATKEDVLELRHDLDTKILGVEAKVHREINRLIFWLVPVLLAYGAALVRLG